MKHTCPKSTAPNPAALSVERLVEGGAGREYHYVYCRPAAHRGREVARVVVTFLHLEGEEIVVLCEGEKRFFTKELVGLVAWDAGIFCCNYLAPLA